MLCDVQKAAFLALAIVLVLLPIVELFDHWESFGSDPELISSCVVLGIALSFLVVFQRAALHCLRRLWPIRIAPLEWSAPASRYPGIAGSVSLRTRAPIRI